jgi:hypothetical protein
MPRRSSGALRAAVLFARSRGRLWLEGYRGEWCALIRVRTQSLRLDPPRFRPRCSWSAYKPAVLPYRLIGRNRSGRTLIVLYCSSSSPSFREFKSGDPETAADESLCLADPCCQAQLPDRLERCVAHGLALQSRSISLLSEKEPKDLQRGRIEPAPATEVNGSRRTGAASHAVKQAPPLHPDP